jgi:KaiC/GvpD/RAD55 family RecA-like ATPase
MSLFARAEASPARIKMMVYGKTGTGKTVASLQFPNPVVIDTEKGTQYYGEHFTFDRLETVDPDKVIEALDELIEDPKNYKTCIIDSVSVLCDLIVDKHTMRKRLKTGDDNAVLQGLDFGAVKTDIKALIKRLLALDMNIIVTAHSKDVFAKGKFMEIEGTVPESHKDLPYVFDALLELQREKDTNRFLARVEKSRIDALPDKDEVFEFSYESFVEMLGIEGMERDASAFEQKREINARSGRSTQIEIDGNEVFTAGIDSETLISIKELISDADPEAVEHMLNENYMVTSLLDLRVDEAKAFLAEVQSAKQNKENN